MPIDNPYAGDDFGPWWQLGYDEGISRPPDVPSAPYVLSDEALVAWSEGALAGNSDGATDGWLVRLDVNGEGLKPTEAELAVVVGHGVAEGLIMVGEVVVAKSKLGVGFLPLTVFLILLDLESYDPTDAQVMMLVGGALSKVCGEKECGELFLPMCVSRAHSGQGDPMLDAGYWHGGPHLDWDGSLPEVGAHLAEHPDHDAGVMRYQPAGDSNRWEWIERPTA